MSSSTSTRSARRAHPPVRLVSVTSEPFADDEALVEGLRNGDSVALGVWYDRFAPEVLRVLARLLGPDSELADLHHDVFVRALSSIRTLRDASALRPWLVAVTVHTARTCILRRQRSRWLRWFSPSRLPDRPAPEVAGEAVEAVREVYRLLDAMSAEDRLVFALRFLEGLELQEVASALGISLATAKRQVARARDRFWTRAQRSPSLTEWINKEVRDEDK